MTQELLDKIKATFIEKPELLKRVKAVAIMANATDEMRDAITSGDFELLERLINNLHAKLRKLQSPDFPAGSFHST